ncbi:MAG: hypothetical protein RL274_1443, partial [Pseudomonadota bacterium]
LDPLRQLAWAVLGVVVLHFGLVAALPGEGEHEHEDDETARVPGIDLAECANEGILFPGGCGHGSVLLHAEFLVDLVLALFPFEVPFFEKYGLKAVFVGHPVVERAARMTGGAALRVRLGIAANAPLLALLPGSRTSEIRFILPAFRAAVDILARKIPGLVTVLPTVPHVAGKVRAATAGWATPLHIVESEADKYAAFDAADTALAASGTVTAELALSRTPMVVAYKVGGLTYFLSRWMMTVKHFTLINILLEREAVPEYLQAAATPETLTDAVVRLFADPAARASQVAAMNEFAHRLGEGDEPPSTRAARVLLDFVES